VVMLDRRKLAVPLFAQAGAFVAVLVIGGFTGHAPAKTPSPQGSGVTASPSSSVSPGRSPSTASPSTASPSAASPSQASTKGPAVKLSVKVSEHGVNGLSAAGDDVSGSQVRVLQSGSLASVASGTLSSAQEYAANVPAGQYQVCIDPPIGWGSAVRSTQVLSGWICSAADLTKGPQVVTFRLTPQIPQAGQ
jgi:hypothetical protein